MSTDSIVVSVKKVSKTYRLWNSPGDRLMYRLKRAANSLLPAKFRKSVEIELSGSRDFHALHDVSFEIRKGESWGIIGNNGSGKSTLLKIIAGNLRPSTGSVEVDGKVAILDYGSGFNGDFTGRENIFLKGALLGLSKKQLDERFQAITEFADIGEFIDQPVKTYSTGMGARLGFAIMAHVDADIMITDEALGVGDAFFVQKCMRHIRSFLERGTFLFVSHSTNDVLSLCQKAIWLEHGVVRAIGSAQEVTNAYLGTQALSRAEGLNIDKGSKSAPASAGQVSGDVILGQPMLSRLMDHKAPRVIRDARLDYINRSPWRNDIQIPAFAPDQEGFGAGGAKVLNVTLCDDEEQPLSWTVGGEMVTLAVEIVAQRQLKSPIVGFQVKDRLGQSLFADNSFLVGTERPFVVQEGTTFTAQFVFQMPLLPVGEYVIRAAVATGEEATAIPLHVLDSALILRSVASSARHGLVGVPMHSIRIKCSDPSGSHGHSCVDELNGEGL